MKPYRTTNEILQAKAKKAALEFLSDVDEATRGKFMQLSIFIEAAIQTLLYIEGSMREKVKDKVDLKQLVQDFEYLSCTNQKVVDTMFKRNIEEFFKRFFILKKDLKNYADHMDTLPDKVLDNFFSAVATMDYKTKTIINDNESEKNNQNSSN